MDLAFTDDQASLRDLAKQIFIGYCTDEKLRALEKTGAAFDPDLWAELARAHLLGFGVSEEMGGNGEDRDGPTHDLSRPGQTDRVVRRGPRRDAVPVLQEQRERPGPAG